MTLAMMVRMLALAMIWGGSFLFMRIAVPEFGTGFTAAGRIALSALVLLAFVRLQGLDLQWHRHWRAYAWIGALSAGVPFLLFAHMAKYLPAGYSAVLNATVPLFAVLLGWYLQRTRPSLSKLAGVVVGLAGVVTIARFGTVTLTAATALAFVAGLLAAALYALGAAELRRLFAGTPPVVAATGSQVGAALLLSPLLLLNTPTHLPPLAPGLALVALGLVCTAVAFVVYFRLLRDAGPERATTVTFLVPVFAQIWGAVFLHEPITAASLAGLGLVMLAVLLVFEKLRLPQRRVAAVAVALKPCVTGKE
ncbi:threonine/homoserine efflux transporter RhtA [Tahibacter aquaticus]|uniref:Threonine/homoserine efflux transporter RhtA n=1 Tax=Tahibacter aquaticus TaxID=520092 RepID=A0A4R6YQ04_9GAMM|nr:DMT family transporter [Tahibacter aquaticus]TDR39754.1 threonine/homoserine efflux transporter RhtA [Tahibacter aquaticus]